MPDKSTSIAAAVERVTSPSLARVLRDYWELTKPEISFLVTVSALAGFLFGSTDGLDLVTLFFTLFGTGLTAAGVGALNHLLERDLDARMRRTSQRPLPAGRIAPANARNLGCLLVCAGVGLLCPLVNVLTAALAIATVVLYLFVYTPLKQRTKYNTLIGTVPGALPALGGFAAATGTLDVAGWTAFGILAAWQMPHFLALAWMYRKDYGRADYAMLPVVEPDGSSTARQTVFFTALLLAVSLTPTLVGAAGLLYLIGSAVLGVWFLLHALRFYYDRTGQRARRVLIASIIYIPVWVALIVVDYLLRIV